MTAATTGVATTLEVDEEIEPSTPPLQSGIVLMPEVARDEDESDEDEVRDEVRDEVTSFSPQNDVDPIVTASVHDDDSDEVEAALCALEHEHEHELDEGFAVVTLEEVELLDPAAPPSVRRRRELRRHISRAGQRRDRSERAAASRRHLEVNAPGTEALAKGMGVLLLLVAIWITLSALLQ